MKTLILPVFLFASLYLISCDKDDNPVVSYDYHAHIAQPSSSDKNLGDVLPIEVEFESHSGEAVEHVNIRIFNKANPSLVVYDKPTDAHVPGGGADYTYQDQFTLSTANGVTSGDWILEAKVWGEEDGQDEVVERFEFHVHP